MQYYNSENDDDPNTTEKWESDFNEDIFNDIEDDRIDVKYEVKEEEIASRNKKDKNTTRMHIRISDYPDLDGDAYAWPGVKEKFEVLLEAQGLNELVNIEDVDSHGLKIYVKEGYEEINQ